MSLDFYLKAAEEAIGCASATDEAINFCRGVDVCTIRDPDISVLEHQAFLLYVWEKVKERFGE